MLHHIESCQFSLFLNGALYSAPFSSPTGATILTHAVILLITPADIIEPTSASTTGFAARIEVVNHTSYNPLIKLNNPGGSAPNDICANLTLFFLRPFP